MLLPLLSTVVGWSVRYKAKKLRQNRKWCWFIVALGKWLKKFKQTKRKEKKGKGSWVIVNSTDGSGLRSEVSPFIFHRRRQASFKIRTCFCNFRRSAFFIESQKAKKKSTQIILPVELGSTADGLENIGAREKPSYPEAICSVVMDFYWAWWDLGMFL